MAPGKDVTPRRAGRRKLILDVDTGTDDAVAIMLAALNPDLDLLACTTVNGNVVVEHCTDNTLRVLDTIGRGDIPVHAGATRPLARIDFPVPRWKEDKAGAYHGLVLPLPETPLRKAEAGAVEFLIETYRAASDPITLVAVAPLTNVAAALLLWPELVERVPELVIMGGGHAIGNVTPSAEFNVWGDPEAASVVLAAGFEHVTLVPLDATHRALVTRDDCAALAALGTPAGRAASVLIGDRIATHDQSQRMPGGGATPVHDALAVASLVRSELLTTQRAHVAVETSGALTVGRTVMDFHARGDGIPNCDVAMDADARGFVALLMETFAGR